MIDIDKLSDSAHRIVVMAEFHQADSERLVEFAQQQLGAGKGGNVLIDLTAVADFTFAAIAVEFGHIPTLMKWIYSLDRIAIISDDAWLRSAARLESALLPGVAYAVYDDDEADAARAWVLGESDGAHKGAVTELDIGKPGIVAFELSGRLDSAESERVVGMALQRLQESGASRFMLVIRNWHGFDLDRLFSSEIFSAKLEIIRRLERYAIVGGPAWVRAYAEFTGNFVQADIRGFELDKQGEAIAWLEA